MTLIEESIDLASAPANDEFRPAIHGGKESPCLRQGDRPEMAALGPRFGALRDAGEPSNVNLAQALTEPEGAKDQASSYVLHRAEDGVMVLSRGYPPRAGRAQRGGLYGLSPLTNFAGAFTSGMTIVGAAFSSDMAARLAELELVEQLALDPRAVDRAPSGAAGCRSEGRTIVAARLRKVDLPEATRILVRHGGEIVTEIAVPNRPTSTLTVAARTRRRTDPETGAAG